MQLHKVTSGLQSLTPKDHNLHEGAGTMFAGTAQQIRGPSAEPGPSSQLNSVAIALAAALQSLNRPVTKATHKSHTCRKYGVDSCQEKKEVKCCLNVCQDCGLKNCKRRNSKKPQISCREGWDD